MKGRRKKSWMEEREGRRWRQKRRSKRKEL